MSALSKDSTQLSLEKINESRDKSKLDDFIEMKSRLMKISINDETNLYDHLKSTLRLILEERPQNCLEIFEDISRDVKRPSHLVANKSVDRTIENALAEIQKKLFHKGENDEDEGGIEEDMETALPDLAQTAFFFEQAGVGLSWEELTRLWLSMKSFIDSHPVEKARFWGKIFGVEQDYYVLEVEFREGEEGEEGEEGGDDGDEAGGEDGDANDATRNPDDFGDEDEEEAGAQDLPPQPTWKKPAPVPREPNRTGVNRKSYFVCNEPGKSWTRLPPATPGIIVAARNCKRYFTGRLDARVLSTPTPFPGLEIHLLRAQIARISAGTQISPTGFYMFDEEEEEEVGEEEGGAGAVRENYIENPEYDPVTLRELIEPGLMNWVHHTLHILPQGRCSWWDPNRKGDDEEEEFEEEDEDEDGEEGKPGVVQARPEKGPPLLNSVSEDVAMDGVQPWSVRLSSNRLPQYAIAVVSSNLWPGAHAFAGGKTFENIYIGWGTKYTPLNYSPPQLDDLMTEYTTGPEIMETVDPTPEDEAALRAAKATDEEGMEEQEEEMDEDD